MRFVDSRETGGPEAPIGQDQRMLTTSNLRDNKRLSWKIIEKLTRRRKRHMDGALLLRA
jgi:hypothetical protein